MYIVSIQMTNRPSHLYRCAFSTGNRNIRFARQTFFQLLMAIVAFIAIAGDGAASLQAETNSPVDNSAAKDASQGSSAVAQSFVARLATNDFSGATEYYDATMKSALPAEKLSAIWLGLLKEAGPFQKVDHVQAEHLSGYLVVYVTCQFEKQLIAVKVVVDNTGKVAGLFFVPGQPAQSECPAYANPSLFREQPVVVGSGEWQLPGTLTVPKTQGPFPAVVLVQGSGPQDRDETIGQNKPFRDLAWGLASKGIAVLRYEKRTKAYASKLAALQNGLTVRQETISDALAAAQLLRQSDGVAPGRVFVLGHSLGGILAPRIGAADTQLAGLIILAGAARPIEDLMLEQTLFQASLAGQATPDSTTRVEEIKRQVAAVKALSNTSPTNAFLLGAPASYWLDLKDYQPATAARQLAMPLLILQGENDCQVSFQADFSLWRQALAGRKQATFKSYPALNHLFIRVDSQSTGAEYEAPGHVDADVVRDIADWVLATR